MPDSKSSSKLSPTSDLPETGGREDSVLLPLLEDTAPTELEHHTAGASEIGPLELDSLNVESDGTWSLDLAKLVPSAPETEVRLKRVQGHWIACTAHSERFEQTYAGLGASPGEAVCELLANLNASLPLAKMEELTRLSKVSPSREHTEATPSSDDDEPLFLEEFLRREGAFFVRDDPRRRPS